jgi:NadR type nicotinamide-nucleotide adenylyltransferase
MKNLSIPVLKIAIVGPESTGKSELAAALAAHYKTPWVKEYAREYLTNLNRNYNYDDLLEIAKGQVLAEKKTIKNTTDNISPMGPDSYGDRRLLFFDTNLTVVKIWSEYKYGICDEWITSEVKNRKYDLHLLTDIDLPWQADPLRENPDNRKELFDLYFNELKHQQVAFEIVKGLGTERIRNAITIIENLLLSFTKN